ncbi:MAG TPA: hypothetical protein VFT37_12530 [Telluria sp.]|nr:hypothetical protein [Telluria sp.]
MQVKKNEVPEQLVAYSHRMLTVALVVILMLGVTAIGMAIHAGPGLNFMPFMPIVITIAVLGLRKRGDRLAAEHPEVMKDILEDELRQQSLNRAYRNGLFAVLALQPLLAFGLASFPASYPLALMASATLTVGAVVVLASLLVYDR